MIVRITDENEKLLPRFHVKSRTNYFSFSYVSELALSVDFYSIIVHNLKTIIFVANELFVTTKRFATFKSINTTMIINKYQM